MKIIANYFARDEQQAKIIISKINKIKPDKGQVR